MRLANALRELIEGLIGLYKYVHDSTENSYHRDERSNYVTAADAATTTTAAVAVIAIAATAFASAADADAYSFMGIDAKRQCAFNFILIKGHCSMFTP